MGGISTNGIDLNQLTNGRYDPWVALLNNAEWLGSGSDYIKFAELDHVHNIFLDTLRKVRRFYSGAVFCDGELFGWKGADDESNSVQSYLK